MSIESKLFFLLLILSIYCISSKADEVSTDIKCIFCETTEEMCTTDPDKVSGSCNGTENGCFFSLDNSEKIRRGCLDGITTCNIESNCKSCQGDKCNNAKDVFTCKSCDSSTDVNCATWADETKIKNNICEADIKKCVMQIKEDKHIQRRCATKMDEKCPEGKECEMCESKGCNKDVYPKSRRRCLQCDDTIKNCGNLADNFNPSLSCTLYDKADTCFVYGTSDLAMNRGCSSDKVVFDKCLVQKEKCTQCATDNCNNSKFKKTQSIKCIQCTAADTGCAWGHVDTEAKNCEIEYWQTEGCYTNKVDADKTDRGCITDLPNTQTCSTESTTCTTCNTNACNKANVKDYSCYKCRSDENKSCANKLEGEAYKSQRCRNPVTESDQGCYIDKWNGIVIRSCLVDADEKTKNNCKDPNYKDCSFCEEINCNTDAPPNSSTRSVLGSILLAVTLMVIKFF